MYWQVYILYITVSTSLFCKDFLNFLSFHLAGRGGASRAFPSWWAELLGPSTVPVAGAPCGHPGHLVFLHLAKLVWWFGYPLLHKDHCLACDRLGPETHQFTGNFIFWMADENPSQTGSNEERTHNFEDAHSRNIGGTQFSQEKHLRHSSTLIQMRAVYTIYMFFSSGACNNLMSGFCHPDIQMFDGTEIRLNPRNDF